MGRKERGKLCRGDLGNEEKEMKEKKMNEKEEELNGMRGDRKTEPALRCQLTPQIHSKGRHQKKKCPFCSLLLRRGGAGSAEMSKDYKAFL